MESIPILSFYHRLIFLCIYLFHLQPEVASIPLYLAMFPGFLEEDIPSSSKETLVKSTVH